MASEIKHKFFVRERPDGKFALSVTPEIEEVDMPILARIAFKISEKLDWCNPGEKKHRFAFDMDGVYLDYEPKPDGTTLEIVIDIYSGLEATSNSKEVIEQIKPIFEKELS